ncbi:MAG: hypothetical protein IT374_24675 [Polyangiaceae bacterium]|nr:hypothetical protein [Polyangiaceae bacterium]
MELLRRVNLFWLGAGLFLALFGANEVVAYYTMPVRRWLGGPLALVGEIAATLLGLWIVYTLGFEAPPEPEAPRARDDDPA